MMALHVGSPPDFVGGRQRCDGTAVGPPSDLVLGRRVRLASRLSRRTSPPSTAKQQENALAKSSQWRCEAVNRDVDVRAQARARTCSVHACKHLCARRYGGYCDAFGVAMGLPGVSAAAGHREYLALLQWGRE